MQDQAPLGDEAFWAGYLAHVEARRAASLSGGRRLVPDGLWIAVTENCNFRCIGCWREGLFKKTYIGTEDLGRMLSGAGGESYDYISLTTGEAFLHPQFCDLIEICRAAQPRAKIFVISNGSIPPKGRFGQAVAMIDHLGLSIDGARPETFEAIRRGGNFAKFVENARDVVAIRRATGNPAELGFCFTANTMNLAELPDVVRLAAQIGVPVVYAQPMEMEHPEIVARAGQYHLRHMPIEEVYRIGEAAVALGRELGVQVDLAGFLIRPPAEQADQAHHADQAAPPPEPTDALIARDVRLCQYPYEKPFQFTRAGEKFQVLPCCYMVEDTGAKMAARYGMEWDSPPPVGEVYNSEAFWQFRRDLAAGRAGDLCGRCMQARTYPWKGAT